jgi:hypothetical protein
VNPVFRFKNGKEEKCVFITIATPISI